MVSMSLTIKQYSQQNVKLYISCYNFSQGLSWHNTQASVVSQTLPFNLIRFGHDGTKCCILLGATNTSWDYLSINIDSVILTNNVPEAWLNADNWSISLITSENNTGIQSNVSLTLKEKVDKITPITAVTTAAAKKIAYNEQGQITATADLTKSDLGLGNVTNTEQEGRIIKLFSYVHPGWWANKTSDGFVIQGVFLNASLGNNTITLPYPMDSQNYIAVTGVLYAYASASGTMPLVSIVSKTTTTIQLCVSASSCTIFAIILGTTP